MTRMLKTTALVLAAVLYTSSASAEIFTKAKLYSIDATGWHHNPSPRGDSGDIFGCDDCDAQVQVQIDYGAPLEADSEYKTNDEFLKRLDTESSQREFAQLLLGSSIPPDSGLEISIEQVGVANIGGLMALKYSALVSTSPKATRESALVAIHKNRIVKITLNYFDNGKGEKADAKIDALFKSLKFF